MAFKVYFFLSYTACLSLFSFLESLSSSVLTWDQYFWKGQFSHEVCLFILGWLASMAFLCVFLFWGSYVVSLSSHPCNSYELIFPFFCAVQPKALLYACKRLEWCSMLRTEEVRCEIWQTLSTGLKSLDPPNVQQHWCFLVLSRRGVRWEQRQLTWLLGCKGASLQCALLLMILMERLQPACHLCPCCQHARPGACGLCRLKRNLRSLGSLCAGQNVLEWGFQQFKTFL